MRRLSAFLLAALGAAGTLAAQAAAPGEGVQIRVNGDATVGPDARDEVVLVVRGDARVHGTVRALVVIHGNAVLEGATVEDLTVVQGRAELLGRTTVTGDVHLVDAELVQDEGARVLGRVERGYGWQMIQGIWLFAAVFALGLSLAMMLAALVAAAVAPAPVRRAGAALTGEIGPTLLAALVVWVALPIAAAVLVATVIGIPTALGILLFLMPALGFLGYLVTGTRLGDWIVGMLRGGPETGHPYAAALIGVGALLVIARVPVIGGIVTPLAGILGGGAIGLVAWRAMRARPAEPRAAPVEHPVGA